MRYLANYCSPTTRRSRRRLASLRRHPAPGRADRRFRAYNCRALRRGSRVQMVLICTAVGLCGCDAADAPKAGKPAGWPWSLRPRGPGVMWSASKSGDPFILSRGEEALAYAEAGIRCDVVPGVSSATAAPALAGIPLTHGACFSPSPWFPPPATRASRQPGRLGGPGALGQYAGAADGRPQPVQCRPAAPPPRQTSGTAVAYAERAATARQQVIRCTLRELALPGSSPGIANPVVMDTTWDWSEQAAD
jgi:Tetrapyrrole (Corrin/Porphyrin) Methylases